MKSNNYHHGDLRVSLIRVATQILRDKGADALTLRGLAAELQVSRTAPYRHFKDKNALMAGIAQEGFALFEQTLGNAWNENAHLPADARFVAVAHHYIDFSITWPEYYQLMFGSSELLQRPTEDLQKNADRAFRQLRDMLEYCQSEGVFKADDSLLQARFVWSAMHGYCSIISVHDKQKSASMMDESAYFIGNIVTALKIPN